MCLVDNGPFTRSQSLPRRHDESSDYSERDREGKIYPQPVSDEDVVPSKANQFAYFATSQDNASQ